MKVLVSLLVAALLLLSTAPAFALDQKCRALYANKRLEAAASCYTSLAKEVQSNKTLASVVKVLRDRFLRNAAVLFNKAAQKQTKLDHKGELYERAISKLKETRQTCDATRRCKQNEAFIKELKEAIGYGRLIVITGQSDALISVTGYRHRSSAKKLYNKQLRPGRYEIQVKQGGRVKKRTKMTLKPGHSAVIDAKPAQIKIVEKRIIVAQTIPPLVLVGYIAGGAILLGGIGLTAGGYGWQVDLNNCRQNASCPQQSNVYNREFDQGQTFVTLGYVVAATGILLTGGGAIAHLIAARASARKPPPLKRKLTQNLHEGQPLVLLQGQP